MIDGPRVSLPRRAALALLCLASTAMGCQPTYESGDIVFHTSKSAQSECLQRIMNSPYTHMGLIYVRDGEPFVYEAVGPVKLTSLDEWVSRGAKGRYVVKRLREADTLLSDEALTTMRNVGERFSGRPYDPYFQWSDELVYCSELVWKIYEEALGIEVGERQFFSDFDLSDEKCSTLIKQRYPNGLCMADGPQGGCINPQEPVISPVAMFESDLLETVYRN